DPGQDMARIWPGYGQDMARIWPGYGQDMARIWPGYGQDFRKWNSDQYLPENRQDEKRPNDVTGDGLTPVTPVFADM
ncbi:MAG: hypothetical protein ACU0BG_14600, partial [Paracoccus sp. (in: a-proteobacteria)]|uniref:hypothetical protein n=1 Tax=Paracoccus sp. TaxID=267 RepID=UPI0040599092